MREEDSWAHIRTWIEGGNQFHEFNQDGIRRRCGLYYDNPQLIYVGCPACEEIAYRKRLAPYQRRITELEVLVAKLKEKP